MSLSASQTRRDFLKQAGQALAAISFPVIDANERKKPEVSAAIKSKELRPFNVAMQTAGLLVGEFLLASCLHSLRIPVGNAGMTGKGKNLSLTQKLRLEELLKNEPERVCAVVFLTATVKAPFIEEAVFRAFPSIFASKHSVDWTMGTISSVIFAGAHALEPAALGEDKPFFNRMKTLPAPQALGGLFFWHLHRNYGFSSALLGHALGNLLPAAAMVYGLKEEHKVLQRESCDSKAILPPDSVLYIMKFLLRQKSSLSPKD